MQVLHVYSGNLYGGIETLLVSLAHARSWQVESHFALCFEGRLSQALEAAGVPVHLLGSVRASRPWTVLRARSVLRDLLDKRRFDVVVCHSIWSQAVFGTEARLKGVPQIMWVHDSIWGRGWLEAWARRHEPDAALCNSRFTASQISHLYPATPASVIYYPVAGPTGSRKAGEGEAVRREIGTESGTIVIIQASRMDSWKGHRVHLDALASLSNVPNWEAWFLGGAQRPQEKVYVDELRRRALSLGIADRVRFLGERADVARLLIAADICCQPNVRPEPFGIAFVEALRHGIPMVTTAMGGAMEVVDESCGILVRAGDPSELAGALRKLVMDRALRYSLGSAGPAKADALCNEQRQLEKLYQFFGKVAARLVPEPCEIGC